MNFARAWRIPGAALVVAMTPLGLTLAGPYLEEVDRGSSVSHVQLRRRENISMIDCSAAAVQVRALPRTAWTRL